MLTGSCPESKIDAYLALFSSKVACKLGKGGIPSSLRIPSTSFFAVSYSPSVIVLILVLNSFISFKRVDSLRSTCVISQNASHSDADARTFSRSSLTSRRHSNKRARSDSSQVFSALTSSNFLFRCSSEECADRIWAVCNCKVRECFLGTTCRCVLDKPLVAKLT